MAQKFSAGEGLCRYHLVGTIDGPLQEKGQRFLKGAENMGGSLVPRPRIKALEPSVQAQSTTVLGAELPIAGRHQPVRKGTHA